jgi:hypothetical protein
MNRRPWINGAFVGWQTFARRFLLLFLFFFNGLSA